VWVVKNTGSIAWDQHAVDYSYASGDALQKMAKNYDLPARVEPGDEVTLRGDMTAPANAGTYHTVWAVRGDRGTLCSLPFTLVVK
jgi:hypothetical protein